MKHLFRYTALIAACATVATFFLPACTTENDMTDEDLAALQAAIAAAYEYEDSYSLKVETDFVIQAADAECTDINNYNLVESITYSKDSGRMAYYAESTDEYISTYTDAETGEAVTESEDSVLNSGDYVVPENGVYNEYVYSYEGGSAAGDVETMTTLKYEYAAEEELSGYTMYKRLGNVFDDFLAIDVSSVNDFATVEELENSLIEADSDESVTYEIVTGKKKGKTYYRIGTSLNAQDGKENYDQNLELTVDGGRLVSVSLYINYGLLASSSDDEEERYSYKMESSVTAGIGYSYNSEIIPPESELSLYAKAN